MSAELPSPSQRYYVNAGGVQALHYKDSMRLDLLPENGEDAFELVAHNNKLFYGAPALNGLFRPSGSYEAVVFGADRVRNMRLYGTFKVPLHGIIVEKHVGDRLAELVLPVAIKASSLDSLVQLFSHEVHRIEEALHQESA